MADYNRGQLFYTGDILMAQALTPDNIQALKKTHEEFLRAWPIKRVKTMSLADYVGGDESFCYALEHGPTDGLGGIGGGNASKSGIYRMKKKTTTLAGVRHDGTYAWKSELGSSREEAWRQVHSNLMAIIKAAQHGDLETIEQADHCFWNAFKWKIAFLYQDQAYPKVIPVYNKSMLQKAAKDLLGRTDLVEAENPALFSALIAHHPKLDIHEIGYAVWQAGWQAGKPEAGPTPPIAAVVAENKIFYGPPGTGKTYHTVTAALEILDPEFLKNNRENRPKLNVRFNQLRNLGHVEFTTFHQSFSYEDFVEGLKAFSDEDTKSIRYEVADGVFKEFCLKAKPQDSVASRATSSKTAFDLTGRRIWKMSLGNTLGADAGIFEECLKQSVILLGYGRRLDFGSCKSSDAIRKKLAESNYEAKDQDYTVTSVNIFRNQMKAGDLVVVSEGNHKVRAIAEITSDYRFLGDQREDHYVQSRAVNWLQHFAPSLPASSILNCSFSQMTLYELKGSVLKREQLLERIQANAGGAGGPVSATIPYVFIIDEINRGNISKVFGELITLIESDKRAGASEAISVRLPYSKEPFSIPANVHIIGTMNTADRSLAQLDIALRRRFTFHEMMPKSELLADIGEIEGVNVKLMFEAINDRIELLYDREHMIGHSFFLPLKEKGNAAIEDLAEIMAGKILPLLEEYFYADWEKIHVVLGNQQDRDLAFIRQKFVDDAKRNKLLRSYESNTKVYERNLAALKNPVAYIGIYQDAK